MINDLIRYNGSFIKTFFSHPGFRFVFIMRCCKKYAKYNLIGIFARVWFQRLQAFYGFQIPHTTKIGEGLFLGHYGKIVINQQAVIGRNCNIAQGVTIGYISVGEKKGAPLIGDRVWIGANSVIVGDISIGNDVLIAPLTLVNFDVPDKAVVLGNPAKIISYTGSEGYVNNQIP